MPNHSVKWPILPKDFITTLVTVGLLLLIAHPCCTQTTSQKMPKKRVLKATTIEIAPFLMVSANGNQSTMEGVIVDILKEIEKVLDVSFEITFVKDGRYGRKDDLGNWTGMVGEVISGHADIAAAPLTVSSERLLHVDMSHPFISYGLKIVIKRPQINYTPNHIALVLKPFRPLVWILVLLAYGVTGVALGVIGRFSPNEWTNTSAIQVDKEKRESFNWGNSFWYLLTTFLHQGFQHYPRSYSGRIVSVSWWIFALLTLAMYFACMIGQLQTDLNISVTVPFETFDEMSRQTEVQYGTLKSSSTFNYFKNSDQVTEQRIYKHMYNSKSNMVSDITEGLKKVRYSNGRYAFIMEGALAEYMVSRYPCDLMVVGEDIYKHSYSFVTAKGSALSLELNYAILKLHEQGVIARIHKKWQMDECFKQSNQPNYSNKLTYYNRMENKRVLNWFSVLGPNFIAGPLIILLVGIFASAIALVVEIFLNKEATKRGLSSSEDAHQLNDNFDNEN